MGFRVGCRCTISTFSDAGYLIRRLRDAKGWSQEDYADRAGIHRTYVSDIERAARNPTITIVEKLAKPLKVTPSALLE